MPEIFLSYRRADASRAAARLFGSLSQRFGAERVFRDLESIEAGENFEDAIRDAVGSAGAVLVLIGPRWLELRADDGNRRLDDPLDYVRREIELALTQDTPVIPVLVENAVVPAAEGLPQGMRELAKRNAIALSEERWNDDVEVLLRQLERGGIAPAPSYRPRQETVGRAIYPAIRTAIADFVPNLFSLLRHPQRFLRRCASGEAVDLTRAFAFFTIAVVLAIVILVSGYTPTQPVLSFGLTVFTTGLISTLAISAPLWAAWRLVGARRHYMRLLTILLHQIAILHLAVLALLCAVIFAMELRSRNVISDMISEAMKPGQSVDTALDTFRAALEPLASSGLVQTALAVSALVMLGMLAWLISSWGAYRQIFGVSRARSASASTLFILIAVAIAALVDVLVAST